MSRRVSGTSSKKMRWSGSQPGASFAFSRKPTKALKQREVQEAAANARTRLKDRSHMDLSSHDVPDTYDTTPFATGEDDLDHDDEGTAPPSTQASNEQSAADVLMGILEGRVALDASSAGGEFSALLNAFKRGKSKKKRGYEGRTRRDRVERASRGFEAQIGALTDAFMLWQSTVGREGFGGTSPKNVDPPSGAGSQVIVLQVLDVFASFKYHALISPGDVTIAACLLRHGVVPNSPFKPTYGVSIRTLELYRSIHLRCPHLALEPYIKGLFDIHGHSYTPSFRRHFSSCYDMYLRLRDEAQKRVDQALQRDQGNWRRRNACSACTYRLEGEKKLVFDMLVTMDGNDSLKRILRRSDDVVEVEGEGGISTTYQSSERPDCRRVEGDYYLRREEVDKWARGLVHDALAEGASALSGQDPDTEATPCEGRWKNMDTDATARMWGIFDETGIFLCLCRHGFVLIVLDMVQSGELTKYPLAVVDALLDAFGSNIGGGYDIGCQFKTRLRTSPLGEKAKRLNYQPLVGAFHGHAHNRLCQLSHLATYVEGLGLEDLEGCERFFSRSNALAAALRYASIFHRQQKILEFIRHHDALDSSQNLSKFLVDNYKQALEILASEKLVAQKMKDYGITNPSMFTEWKEEERSYLESLANEPIQETMQMEYYQKLVNYYDSEKRYNDLKSAFKDTWVAYAPAAPTTGIDNSASPTVVSTNATKPPRTYNRQPHTQLKHAEENVRRCLDAVQDLEIKLDITDRWTDQSPEWETTRNLVNNRRYQRALDELEALVVSRMFELTKMNMSQTGYKLRKHIANALKARSTAIRNALTRYNTAAQALKPPRTTLSWETIVEYAFLADFDLLRDTRQDIRERKWAQPLMRTLMDQYFKIQRAKEEILRLNIEIKRVITHLIDEENFLRGLETLISVTDPTLAHHVSCYRQQRTRFSALHLLRFSALANLKGFTGSIDAGNSIDRSLHARPTTVFQPPMAVDVVSPANTTSVNVGRLVRGAGAGDGYEGVDSSSNEGAEGEGDGNGDDELLDDDDAPDEMADLESRYQMISLLGD